LIGCTNSNEKPIIENPIPPKEKETPELNFTVVRSFPHDTNSYTQGLLVYNDQLFESTGSPKDQRQLRSVLGILDTTTGKIKVKAEIDGKKYFGEGIVILNGKIYQLTWEDQIGFIYNAKTFKPLGQFNFANAEGWGLTTDGKNIIMSDGTNKLTYLNPENLKPIKTIEVTNNGFAEDYLNELEYINGYIYANVYQKMYIVKIDPATGKVVATIDLSSLDNKARSKSVNAEVLNGIAFDPATNKIYVTGKLWPEMYQIDFPH